jgi:hypothetical protein
MDRGMMSDFPYFAVAVLAVIALVWWHEWRHRGGL